MPFLVVGIKRFLNSMSRHVQVFFFFAYFPITLPLPTRLRSGQCIIRESSCFAQITFWYNYFSVLVSVRLFFGMVL